jgi:hypothetical protein
MKPTIIEKLITANYGIMLHIFLSIISLVAITNSFLRGLERSSFWGHFIRKMIQVGKKPRVCASERIFFPPPAAVIHTPKRDARQRRRVGRKVIFCLRQFPQSGNLRIAFHIEWLNVFVLFYGFKLILVLRIRRRLWKIWFWILPRPDFLLSIYLCKTNACWHLPLYFSRDFCL